MYTSAIWGVIFWPPQDKRINQTRGVEEMNWGGWTPQPPAIPTLVFGHLGHYKNYLVDWLIGAGTGRAAGIIGGATSTSCSAIFFCNIQLKVALQTVGLLLTQKCLKIPQLLWGFCSRPHWTPHVPFFENTSEAAEPFEKWGSSWRGGLGDRSPPVGSRGKAPVGDLGGRSWCTFS